MMKFKGIAKRDTSVKSQPIDDEQYIIGELKEGEQVEIDIKDFGHYLISYNERFAYVSEKDIEETTQ